jgi:hypothetical protein
MQNGQVLVNNVAKFGKMRMISSNKRDPVAIVFVLICEGMITGDSSCFGNLRIYHFVFVFTVFEVSGQLNGTMLEGGV